MHSQPFLPVFSLQTHVFAIVDDSVLELCTAFEASVVVGLKYSHLSTTWRLDPIHQAKAFRPTRCIESLALWHTGGMTVFLIQPKRLKLWSSMPTRRGQPMEPSNHASWTLTQHTAAPVRHGHGLLLRFHHGDRPTIITVVRPPVSTFIMSTPTINIHCEASCRQSSRTKWNNGHARRSHCLCSPWSKTMSPKFRALTRLHRTEICKRVRRMSPGIIAVVLQWLADSEYIDTDPPRHSADQDIGFPTLSQYMISAKAQTG